MDLSDYLRAGLKELHRRRFCISHSEVAKQQTERRRSSRLQNLMTLRKITEITLSPINTPKKVENIPKKSSKNEPETKRNSKLNNAKLAQSENVPQPDKRRALLMKWKEEKNKKLQAEKQRKKPIFRVSYHTELPSIENANQTIKGKPISFKLKGNDHTAYSFAPKNHEFKPPDTIKPISLTKNSKMNSKSSTFSLESVTGTDKRSNSPQCNKKKKILNKKLKVDESHSKQKDIDKKKEILKETSKKELHKNTEVKKTQSLKNTINQEHSLKTVNSPKITFDVQKDNKQSKINKTKDDAKQKSKTLKINETENKPADLLDTKNKTKQISSSDKAINKSSSSKGKTRKSKMKETESGLYNQLYIKGKTIQTSSDDKTVNKFSSSSEDDLGVSSLKTNKSYQNTRRRSSKRAFESPDGDTNTKKGNSKTRAHCNKDLPDKSDGDSSPKSLSSDFPIECLSLSSSISSINSVVVSDDQNNIPLIKLDDSVFSGNNASSSNIKTPNSKISPIYISPFVTVSRGKDSARKEFKERLSKGGTFEFLDASKYTSPKAAASYFSDMLNREVSEITALCDQWNNYKTEANLPDGASDMINVAIGQSQLLINQKLQQFRSLVNSANNKEGKVTCQDLHGFWDLVYIQIKNVKERFANLQKLKSNNWEEIICIKTPTKAKLIVRKVNKKRVISKIKNVIDELKQKKKQEMDVQESIKEKRSSVCLKRPNNVNLVTKRQAKGLTSEGRSSSPGLTILKASQSAKHLQQSLSSSSTPINLKSTTPAKSILKSGVGKSSKRRHKSVLFEEEFTEMLPNLVESLHINNQENNANIENTKSPILKSSSEDLIAFISPAKGDDSVAAVRRSARLNSKLPKHKLF